MTSSRTAGSATLDSMHPDWIEHRRSGDGELLGWILPEGEGFVAIDRLGHARTAALDWAEAEGTLEDLGLGYLAEAYELRMTDGTWQRVRLVEVSTEAVTVKEEDWGDITVPQTTHTLPFPAPAALRVRGSST